jgi:uncharacterized protein
VSEAAGSALIAATEARVRTAMDNEGTGHDWWHVDRVRRTALRLAAAEGADPLIVELAALLHDMADWKFAGGDATAGERFARDWLASLEAPADLANRVADIVGRVSFKGAGVPTPMPTIEGAVVQDADRLDALGAIGIARVFAYGGHRGQPLHDPRIEPAPHDSFEAYKGGGGSSVNHFHEKLLLLKDRLNTDAARAIAAERHGYMEAFLERFAEEWEGRA